MRGKAVIPLRARSTLHRPFATSRLGYELLDFHSPTNARQGNITGGQPFLARDRDDVFAHLGVGQLNCPQIELANWNRFPLISCCRSPDEEADVGQGERPRRPGRHPRHGPRRPHGPPGRDPRRARERDGVGGNSLTVERTPAPLRGRAGVGGSRCALRGGRR